MSLTSFVRDNIYMLVIALSRRPALAAVAAMVAMGIWHELSARYLIWGIYHGVGIAIWQVHRSALLPHLPAVGPGMARVAHVGAVALTFHFVAVGFMLVAGDDTSEAWARLQTLFLLH